MIQLPAKRWGDSRGVLALRVQERSERLYALAAEVAARLRVPESRKRR